MNDNILHRSMMGGKFEPLTIHDYMTIEALEDGLTASLSVNACEYCIDGSMNWVSLPAATATPAINAGQTLSFRATLTPTRSNGIGTFTISHKCNLLGNCMAMLYGNGARSQKATKSYAFLKLFYNCVHIMSVSENFLPATTLTFSCYQYMFQGCTSLTTAPKLPATNLNSYCYEYMFKDCTSLTTSPELPATTLINNCYDSMFYGCTSLTTAPELPATTLADNCYDSMFYGCSSLITAPELPATTLTSECYRDMFHNCTSLTTAPELPATTLTGYCYRYMFSGCTSLTTAPELPATTLADGCYQHMFYSCKSLTTAPELPATTLTGYCYLYMFSYCSNLTTAPELPATTLASKCYNYMFYNCTSLTTAPELPATTLADNCYDSMFYGCSSLRAAPELPATTLTDSCYAYMFSYCTSLTTAPELPATTLKDSCYFKMFSGCRKLNYIRMFATDISATNCLTDWVSGVATTGTFTKNILAQWDVVGVNGVPSGWTITYPYTPQECTSLTITADDVSGKSTTTTIHWEAVTNGVNEDGSTVQGIVISGTATSEEFPQNTSETTTITRVVSFTYFGKTATTSITQGVWVNSSYTVVLNDQWQLSTAISNPDSTTYDGVYESFSNYNVNSQYATMYIDITGYETFQLYIRSYAEGNYDYVMVSQLDQTINGNTSYSDATLIKAHTRGSQSSGTAIGNYKLVEFTGIDGGDHRITIVYRKDSSSHSGLDRGYVLIPKNQ